MKKILVILFILSSVIYGCQEDFEPELFGVLSPSTFPTTPSEFELYTMEVYVPFMGKWGYPSSNPQGWEFGFFSPELGHIEMFDMASDFGAVFSGWGGHYQATSSCNFTALKSADAMRHHFEKVRFITRITKIIADLENATVLTEALKKTLIAEAKMARGWSMYYLLHIYGPVPVILDPAKIGTDAEADATRPERADFISWIANDLRFAADNLPLDAVNYGRFTKGSALTVLMRLYLNEKDFLNAEKTGREIVALNKYGLVNDYASLFREATEVNKETIWAISCVGGKETGQNFNALMYYCYSTDCDGLVIKGGGWGDAAGGALTANWKFYHSFDTVNDKRSKLFVTEYISNVDKKTVKDSTKLRGAIIRKYPDEGAPNSYQGNDYIICRYADVLLMLAEAINENSGPVTEAVELVNQIRQRAGIANLSVQQTATKDDLREAIFIERGHELYFEGLRKFDLVRMGKWTQEYLGQFGKTVGPELWPLPDYAIINSNGKLTQNSGY
jgi:starch-binding outer membrane protein, SusD/RagB family